MTTATPPVGSRLKRASIVVIWALLFAVFLAPIVRNIYDHISQPPVMIPDEQLAGQELLAQKFAGPRYFQPDAASAGSSAPSDKYYISVASAKSQVARVAAERKLGTDDVVKLNAIIERIAEPPPSRVVGQNGVNTLRLNLALDALR